MNRRRLLAATALATPLVGCLDDAGVGTGSNNATTPSTGTPAELDADCGPAEQPLSALLTEETGDPSLCFDGATPSFALENERDDAQTVTVEIESETADDLPETDELEPGERVVENSAFEAESDLTGTVSVDGEEDRRITWPERSCYRHGIALTDDGIEVGWIEPLNGPGDTQHDCYAGDSAQLRVDSVDEARTITVTVTDLCDGTEVTETFELEADGTEGTTELLTDGGMYEIRADVDGGPSERDEFTEDCWGVGIGVDADGELELYDIVID